MENILVTAIHRVVFVGKKEYTEKSSTFSNKLLHHELIFHISGHAKVTFDDQILFTQADTIRFLPAGNWREYRVDREEAGECIDIVFDANVPIAEKAFTQRVENQVRMKALFQKLFAVWVGREEGYYYECMALFYQILAELQKKNYLPGRQYQTIKPAIAYIDEHFTDGKISMDFLAQCCGISTSYLKKLFVRKFGISPNRYIIQRKIHFACDLLLMHRYSIAQVAAMCGFEDVSFFSRQFKEYVGVAPTVYSREYQSSK